MNGDENKKHWENVLLSTEILQKWHQWSWTDTNQVALWKFIIGTWCHKLSRQEQQCHEVLHGIPDELAQLKPVAPFGKRLPGQALGAWTHASLVWRTNWAGCADKCENYRRMPGTKSKGSVHFLNHPEHWNWKQCCHGLFAKTRAGHWSGPNRPWPEEHWSRENRPVRSLQQNCTVGDTNSKKMTNSSLHNNNWTIHGTFK